MNAETNTMIVRQYHLAFLAAAALQASANELGGPLGFHYLSSSNATTKARPISTLDLVLCFPFSRRAVPCLPTPK